MIIADGLFRSLDKKEEGLMKDNKSYNPGARVDLSNRLEPARMSSSNLSYGCCGRFTHGTHKGRNLRSSKVMFEGPVCAHRATVKMCNYGSSKKLALPRKQNIRPRPFTATDRHLACSACGYG